MKRNKTLFPVILLMFGLFIVASCAPAPICEDPTFGTPEFGFFRGILHGLVFPIALLGKLFGFSTGLYALNNTGFFYWLGFLIGFGPLGIGFFRFGRK
jgi:hypothetical protein